MQIDAALGFLFTDLPMPGRIAAAAAAGFRGVELAFPYDAFSDAATLRRRLEEHGLSQRCMLAPAGDWAGGERGIAALPGREAEFRDGFRRVLDYAAALRAGPGDGPVVHVAAGLVPAGTDRARCRDLYLEQLAWAAALAGPAGVALGVEPVCRHDYPSFLVNTVAEALALLDAVGAPPHAAGIIFDTWHTGTEEGDLLAPLAACAGRLAHVQLGDAPGRGEPGSGRLDFPGFFAALDRHGYAGWVGCEYRPSTGDTLASLAWGPATA